MSEKRSIEEVNQSLESLLEQEHVSGVIQTKQKRQRTFDPMTQNTQRSSDNSLEDKDINPPAGYIKRIILKNFMCHEHFQLELGSRLNFIIGNNGSGKSAILTAITIGLGAKASITNRGTNLKSLIREGCHSSKIIIILNNSGFGSYNQSVYGNEIKIERTIRKEGTISQFSIKSENDKEITTKKVDLQKIVDFFSIPVLNPMCFLTQDSARSFLTASSPQEKLKHFMRGTLLEEIEINLCKAENLLKSSKACLDLHSLNLKGLKDDYEMAKSLLEEIYKNHDWVKRKKILQGKLCWLIYDENLNKLHKLQGQIDDKNKKISAIDKKIEDKQLKMEKLKVDQETLSHNIENKMQEVHKCNIAYEETQNKVKSFMTQHQDLKQNKEASMKEIQKSQDNIKKYLMKIKTLEEEIRTSSGGNKREMALEIKELKCRIENLEEKENENREYYNTLKIQDEDIYSERKSALNRLESSINVHRYELKELEKNSSNFVTNFDRNMERVLTTIKKKLYLFSATPIGPLGMEVKVKTGFEKWARPIQTVIGGILNAFVVQDIKDSKILRHILEECQIRERFPVITYKLNRFDFSNGKAQSVYPSIIDALEFSSKEIECLFVDQSRIEKIVLVEHKDDAYRLLKQRQQNISMVLSIKNNYSGFQSSISSIGSMRLNTTEYQQRLKMRIGGHNNDDHDYLKSIILEGEKEINNKRVYFDSKISEIRHKINECILKKQEIRENILRLRHQLNDLEFKLDKEIDTGALEEYQLEIKNQNENISNHSTLIDNINNKMGEISEQVLPYKTKHDEVFRAFRKSKNELEGLKDLVESKSQKFVKIQDDIKYYDNKKQEYNNEKLSLDEKIQTFQTALESQKDEAELYCSKNESSSSDIPTTKDEVKSEILIAEKRIVEAEKRIGMTQEQITEYFENTKVKFKDGEARYSEIDKSLWKLDESLKFRRKALDEAISDTCYKADADFRMSMHIRKGFAGALSFSNPGELLVLVKTANDDTPRNVDTLSGGEKSFSQITLLLATWSTMRARIIALDEFDVFMDQVNRTIGTKLIMKKLSSNIRTQTIIITPQDIGKIADINNPGITIHRIRDPERRNNSSFYN